MKKEVVFETHAITEFEELPIPVQKKFKILFDLLQDFGKLAKPDGDKLNSELFEMRVRMQGQWRGFYAYFSGNQVIVLRFFRKKTQKTPKQEIELCMKRLKLIKYGRY